MTAGKYTYEELEALTDHLQRQVSRHIKIEQELIKTRDALDREVARLRVFQNYSGRALGAEGPDELVKISLESIIEAFEFECASIHRWDAREGRLETLGQFGLEAMPRYLPFDPEVLRGEESVILDGAHPQLAQWSELDLAQVIICPLCDGPGMLYGLVLGGRTRSGAQFYDRIPRELESPFAVLAQQIGSVWSNYRLNVLVRQRKYSVLFERSNDGVLLVDTTGKILDTNQRALAMFGYTADEMQQMTVFDLSASEPEESRRLFSRIVDVGSIRFERNCRTKQGSIFPAEVSATLFEVDNSFLVQGLVRDITQRKRSQRQIILSERMAALGQLIAGVAHEINTPVGVIRAAIANMLASLGDTLVELPATIRSLSDVDVAQLSSLLERSRNQRSALSSREERRHRRELASTLAAEGVPDPEAVADKLVTMGVYSEVAEFLPLLGNRRAFEVAFCLSSVQRNADNISSAVDRATKVVFALKKFAHFDPSGEKAPADVVDGIETVVTLYHNRLKHGIELVRDFEDLPLIPCRLDELNQVWTNLIQNALQAMGNQGRLELRARREGDDAMISVIDDGPGVPDEIRERVFEPFFTTKPSGEGSGLGLDICRQIVERHAGAIDFESRPGRTEFRVRLPLSGGPL